MSVFRLSQPAAGARPAIWQALPCFINPRLHLSACPTTLLCCCRSYPASVGRNMDEIVRVVDALLLSAEKSVATPANWPNDHADQVKAETHT